jgi:hypothetical protein
MSTALELLCDPTPIAAPTGVERSPEGHIPASTLRKTTPAFSWSYDKTTKAALTLLTASDNAVINNELEHLTAIVLRACQRLFLPEVGNTSFDAKHSFVRQWLQQKLLPYRNNGSYNEAAEQGEFRYLGKQGRNALIDELRRRARSQDALDQGVISMDHKTEYNGDKFDLHNLLAMNSFEVNTTPLGCEPSLEPSILCREIWRHRNELAQKLGEPSFSVFSTICDLFPDHLSPGNITRAIAKARDVSEQTARKLHNELASKLRAMRRDPSLRDLFEIIGKAGGPASLVNAPRKSSIANKIILALSFCGVRDE